MQPLVLAAEQGDPGAQFDLGIIYGSRINDNARAISSDRVGLDEMARRRSMAWPRAQSRLAELYAGPPATPQGDVSACAWFGPRLASPASPGSMPTPGASPFAWPGIRTRKPDVAPGSGTEGRGRIVGAIGPEGCETKSPAKARSRE